MRWLRVVPWLVPHASLVLIAWTTWNGAFRTRCTSKGRPVRDTAGHAISTRTTYLKSHISGPVFASFLEGNHESLKSKKV